MGKAQISSENMDFMLEMMRKLELDKKLKEEGKKEGEHQKEISIVKKLLSMGMDTKFISEASGLEAEKIEEIKRKLK